MKLKTLQDFKRKQYSEGEDNKGNKIKFFDERELKAEAVKWVKYFKSKKMHSTRLNFMDFFNLTKEDLK